MKLTKQSLLYAPPYFLGAVLALDDAWLRVAGFAILASMAVFFYRQRCFLWFLGVLMASVLPLMKLAFELNAS